MSNTLKIFGLGIIFLVVLISGLILTRTGRPYNALHFNIHKLISIAGVVLAGIYVYNFLIKHNPSSYLLTLSIVVGVLFLVLIISGGLLNLDKSFHHILQIIHRIASTVGIIIFITLFYLMLAK